MSDFIFYLFEVDQEERLYNQWLHTNMQQSFKDFKKQQNVVSLRKRKNSKPVTKQEEQDLLAFASQFVKPTKTGGETQ